MPTHCCIPTCKLGKKKGENVSFYRFPSDNDPDKAHYRQLWKKALNVENLWASCLKQTFHIKKN